MRILIIKQTSLGDVLHASGHIRSVKQQYPDSKLVLQTATTSAEIYAHNPHVDEIIQFDRYDFKKNWIRHPVRAFGNLLATIRRVREQEYDLAIDLQGLAKSMVFLYLARAKKKFAKGKWLGIPGFRNKQLHAIEEMDAVLALAGIEVKDSSMEFPTSDIEKNAIDSLLKQLNPNGLPILIMSPFSRWRSKDWPLEKFIETAQRLGQHYMIVFTGAKDRATEIDQAVTRCDLENVVSVAGTLNLLEFVELVSRSALMLTGDSFPMHVACASKTPVVALFGPTDETKVGPRGPKDRVIRVEDCDQCDRQNCPRQCLARLSVDRVFSSISRPD